MNRTFSLYLDVIRVTAAIVVVLYHFSYRRFSDGRYEAILKLNLGGDAVIVFFVVSGFIIAFSTDKNYATLGSFAFARFTRLISVAFPALLLGFMLDVQGARWYPEFYSADVYYPISLSEQLVRGLSFSNEWVWDPLRIGSNGPYWSLSYEAAYYTLFAIFVFLKGWLRVFLLILAIILFGLNILLLLPCWLLGVWLYRRMSNQNRPLQAPVALTIFAPLLIYILARYAGVPDELRLMTAKMISAEALANLRFSYDFIWYTCLALLVSWHLAGMHKWSSVRPVNKSTLAKPIRLAAVSSFSIYLFHYPVLHFLKPSFAASIPALDNDLGLISSTLIACFIFAAIFEHTIDLQRRYLRQLIAR